jgi:DNA-directed RNA polymerase specialized sigma24 family protein
MTIAERRPPSAANREAEAPTAVAAGDIRSLRAAYDSHATLAWSLAMRLVGGDSACAEDVVEAAFLHLFRTANEGPTAGSVRSRVIALVTREALARTAGPGRSQNGGRRSADSRQLRSR